ncbi:uncharacterized protein LOC133788230 [Humulus lupulus]|uniref:uncharacterized protein LOC133788230 n=1 Tax=Humulus lupulus TaxID=3486 RepID=UPI002B409CA5|nr:uncharacterized protein LOC133788230 [Humulus lupulus]
MAAIAMGENDKARITKARMELEELYSGIPDESVDLTFEDLASFNNSPQNKNPTTTTNLIEPTTQVNSSSVTKVADEQVPHLKKIPSLDFSKALQASIDNHRHHYPLLQIKENDVVHPFGTSISTTTRTSNTAHHQHHHNHGHMNGRHALSSSAGHRGYDGDRHHLGQNHHHTTSSNPFIAESGFRQAVEMSSMAHDDVSCQSMASTYQQRPGAAGRRRPGIPHSKICAICSSYIYIFRHRCLVCGRVYCRQCVKLGMGEMTEGRKCIQCLGKKFSQRYIQRAGETGCFCSRYPTVMRQAELKWAEKGPRRNSERAFGRSGMMSGTMMASISKGPIAPRTLNGLHASSEPNSFVMTPSYSPYTPTHHHYPF